MLFSISDEAEWSIHENFTTSEIIEVYVLNKTVRKLSEMPLECDISLQEEIIFADLKVCKSMTFSPFHCASSENTTTREKNNSTECPKEEFYHR